MRKVLLASLWIFVSAWPAQAQVQDKAAQVCINKLNQDGAAVALQQGKESLACLTAAGKGKLIGSAEICLTADAKAKVEAKRQTTIKDEAKKCSTAPAFAYAGSAAVNDAARAGELDLVGDLFGSPLDAALISCASNAAACKCQQLVAKATETLATTERRIFVNCTRDALKVRKEPFPAGATSAADIGACVDDAGIPTSIAGGGKGSVPRLVDKLADMIAKKCDAPAATAAALDDGICEGRTGAALAACIGSLVSCRVCQTVKTMDALAVDCDAFACSAFHGSVTFESNGGMQDFTVPVRVSQVRIIATGAQGGNGGGLAGAVTAVLPVTPGEVLVIGVGGAGGLFFGEPGFNGGGNGGFRVTDTYLGVGGGGGGASDIRQGGGALENRVLVAAGGGGGMGGNIGILGGNGGGLTGQPGCCLPAWAGGGGTQIGGGLGGGMALSPACAGSSGALGVGGDGAFWVGQPALCSFYGGGGGGGGYYGGGGAGAVGGPAVGVSSGGGGGGSSYAGPTATNVVHGLAPLEAAKVVISW